MNNIDINSSEFCNNYVDTLKQETVDALDGTILSPGQVVIRSPFNTFLVAADSSDRRHQFAELGFAWDEPTRIQIIKTAIDQKAGLPDYGHIRSTDIAYELKLNVKQVEMVFKLLVEKSSDYYLDNSAKDASGKPCLAIDKRH